MRAGRIEAPPEAVVSPRPERAPTHALPRAIGNRAFSRTVQRWYKDPGEKEAWLARAPIHAVPRAIGNRAFSQMVQRWYNDPGDNEYWVAGDEPLATIGDIRDYFQQNFKTVLLVSLNQRPFGRFMSTDDNKHAEENFLDAWEAHWQRAAKKGYLKQHQLNQLEFVMNNSPCAEKCSAKLAQFVGNWNGGTGGHLQCQIRLYIRAQNVYGTDERATRAVENLLQHPDISLEPFNPQVESAVVGLDAFARSPAYVAGQRRRQARAEAFFGADDE